MDESECDEDEFEAYLRRQYNPTPEELELMNETVERKMQLMEM